MTRFLSLTSSAVGVAALLALAGCASTGLSTGFDLGPAEPVDGSVPDASPSDLGPYPYDGGPIYVDGGPYPTDGGPIYVDSGPYPIDGWVYSDGGPYPTDGGPYPYDGGPIFTDGGPFPTDGGPVYVDGGPFPTDGGPIFTDGGARDGGPILSDAGGPPTGSVGAGCATAADCTAIMGGTCITNLGGFITLPGGYCSVACTTAATCGAGATCLTLGFGGGGQCVDTCTASTDCRTAEGYVCQALPFGPGGRVCIPPFGGPGRDGGGPPPIPFDLGAPLPGSDGGVPGFPDGSLPPIPFDLGF